MGCGILYRMVAERIGLGATLATRRTGGYLCGGNGVSVLPYAHPQLFKVFKHLIYV